MKAKIEWRHGNRTLKLNDTDYELFPYDGDIVEMEENGVLHRFRASIESAVIELELAPDDAVGPVEGPDMPVSLSAEQKQARARKSERLAAEATAEEQKTRKFTVATKKKK